MFASSLAHYAETPVNIDRVIAMLLVHDIGEIDTGDTMVYVTEGQAERKLAERVAVERIFGLLPDDHRDKFMSLWQEFEDAETPEARFAHGVKTVLHTHVWLPESARLFRKAALPCGLTWKRS
jgi:putative hydrolase of HD superfamily